MGARSEKRKKALALKQEVRKNKTPEKEYKYLLTIAYDGSKYGGYAKQKHKNTIQNAIEEKLSVFFNTVIKTTEASRTDAKVHALCQKVMFTTTQKVDVNKFRNEMNSLLDSTIMIINVEEVDLSFHCRYGVISKTYEYKINKVYDPRVANHSWIIDRPLNIQAMENAAEALIGKHDFQTFKSAKATTDTSVRTINYLDIKENNKEIIIKINADGFLYNMVRLIVKALVDVGLGNEDESYLKVLLNMSEKPPHLESAPACGLCLIEINYKKHS